MKRLNANPFVVLADVTISLSFIFAIFAVSSSALSSQLLLNFDRNQRQDRIQAKLVSVLSRHFAGPFKTSYERARGQSRAHLVVRGEGGELIAQVWDNGSFQRLIICKPLFPSGGTRLTEEGASVYFDLARQISEDAGEFAYVFIHGIVERREESDLGLTARKSEAVSTERARAVFSKFDEAGLIAAYGINDEDVPLSQIAPKYIIWYGTGSKLYGGYMDTGRADVVLFYADQNKQKESAAGLSGG